MLSNYKSFIAFLVFNLIISQTTNYFSTEYSIKSYFNLMPEISRPFDNKDFYYANLNFSYADHSVGIEHSYRRNKKIKSISKRE